MTKKLTKTMVVPGGESSTNLITSISLTWMIRTTAIEPVMRIFIFVEQKLSSIAENPLSGFSVPSMCLKTNRHLKAEQTKISGTGG